MTPIAFSTLDLWTPRVAYWRSVLEEALILLPSRECGTDETSINRILYQCILEVILDRRRQGRETFDTTPFFDAPGPPVAPVPTRSERKRPDIRWEILDHTAKTRERAIVPFVIECKRLGERVGGRVLVELYVDEGVARFIDVDWSYGQNAPAGVMVGYVQSATFDELVIAVNDVLVARNLPTIVVASTSSTLLTGEHLLVRAFEISPYLLNHAWVDVRLPVVNQADAVEQGPKRSTRARRVRRVGPQV